MMIWADEFDGPAGSAPSLPLWAMHNQTYADELTCYRDDPSNVSLDGNGNLAITARAPGSTWTSARVVTQGHMTFNPPVCIEARIKAPCTPGLCPGFWLLGQPTASTAWPATGEIDIAEFTAPFGARQLNQGIHGPTGAAPTVDCAVTMPTPQLRLAYPDDFHTYTLDWQPHALTWLVDGVQTFSITRDQYRYANLGNAGIGGGDWTPFSGSQDFYLILDISIGATWQGPPTKASAFPAQMLVDYVRVTR